MSKTNRQRITDLQKDLEEFEDRFEQLSEELEEKEQFLENIESHEQRAKDSKNTVQNNKDQVQSAKEDVDNLQSEIKDVKESLDEKLTNAEVKKEDIDKFFTKVFGEKDDEGNRKGGLKSRLDKKEDEIDEFLNTQEERYEELHDKIESLLPGAASVGLAKAFADQKGDYTSPKKWWVFGFIVGIVGIIVTGYLMLGEISSIDSAVTRVITRAPFFIAFIWLATFSSKQYKQNNRLQEEYAHKEVLAKSYQGYRRELKGEESEPESSEKLEKVLVEALKRNPSELVEKGHSSDRPNLLDELNGLKNSE